MMEVKPNGIIVTVRLIRSFEHHNVRPVVFKNIDPNQTVSSFKNTVLTDIKKRTGLPPPVKNYDYDTLKIQHQAHGAKSNDPIINTERDEELILQDHRTLAESNVRTETELSFFKRMDYIKYKENPHLSWPDTATYHSIEQDLLS
ncbi:UPF0538 protein C2orf76 homolog isoform X1 [Tachypleus tridentatus]|uniref:UPF0538 protein C2orf76 homolog isoform X1 n=2 Tax=Tachypleus tridentatus TaxID=6853 RepID=UPI003FCFE2CB